MKSATLEAPEQTEAEPIQLFDTVKAEEKPDNTVLCTYCGEPVNSHNLAHARHFHSACLEIEGLAARKNPEGARGTKERERKEAEEQAAEEQKEREKAAKAEDKEREKAAKNDDRHNKKHHDE